MNSYSLQMAVAGAKKSCGSWRGDLEVPSPKSRCGKVIEGGFDIQCKLSNHFTRSLYHTIM